MANDAASGLAQLDRQRAQAVERVEALEREQAAAALAVRTAAAELAEHERRGGRPAELQKLEAALAEARAAVADPALAVKIEGARARGGDLQVERQRFIAENLRELVDALERDGRAAADRLNAAAEALVAAFGERQRVDQAISQLASAVGRVRAGDVARSHADALVRQRAASSHPSCATTRVRPGTPRS